MEKAASTETTLEIRKCCSCRDPLNLDYYISWELQEFCNVFCVSTFQKIFSTRCSTCLGKIKDRDCGRYHMRLEDSYLTFCSVICSKKYTETMKICNYCEKTQCNEKSTFTSIQLYFNNSPRDLHFCSNACFKKFFKKIKMCPTEIPIGLNCDVCHSDTVTHTVKYDGKAKYLCGVHCQTAFKFVMSGYCAVECKMCHDYISVTTSSKFGALEGKQIVPFCSNSCKSIHMVLNTKLVICNLCQGIKSQFGMLREYVNDISRKVFCCVDCFCKDKGLIIDDMKLYFINKESNIATSNYPSVLKNSYICQKVSKIEQRNVATMCSVIKHNKSTSTQLTYSNMSSQTNLLQSNILIPTPVPVYVPIPVAMYNVPVPCILPIPIPVPIPIFLPCTQDSLTKIWQNLTISPANACEADILNIAEAISEQECVTQTYNECKNPIYAYEKDIEGCKNIDLECLLPTEVSQNVSLCSEEFPLKVRSDCEAEGSRDFANVRCPEKTKYNFKNTTKEQCSKFNNVLAIKRAKDSDVNTRNCSQNARYNSGATQSSKVCTVKNKLNHSLGINALKQWALKALKLHKGFDFVKSEIIDMTPKQLCEALCFFIQELRKPNGTEYAPDTIYYLCLGIQYYLHEKGRTDNIFLEPAYEKFILCLDKFAKKFCTIYDDDSQFYIVSRIDEEHLWETKQLGCWSPYALLNTLVYYNTKYYCRSNLEEHMALSFNLIMKCFTKGMAGIYSVLRLYPKANVKDKRVYEQFENRENPLRCPVKLYEFYLSKCPARVKDSANMVYLKPEKYLVSESPLWYTTEPLPKEYLGALINRVKMVKEINVALLHH